nr:MAG TPA: hypothetical protein [Caudoviricetes sp.]
MTYFYCLYNFKKSRSQDTFYFFYIQSKITKDF